LHPCLGLAASGLKTKEAYLFSRVQDALDPLNCPVSRDAGSYQKTHVDDHQLTDERHMCGQSN